jgi:hypothetical protein
MESLGKYKFFTIFIAAFFCAIFLSSFFRNYIPSSLVGYIKLNEKFNINQVSQTLTVLLLISSFLERALEVYVLTFRADRKLEAEKTTTIDTEKEKNETRRITLWTALAIGIIISIVGVRGLEPFIILDSTDKWQSFWFRTLDILLTGAVIAGGSDVIHKLLQVVTTFMDAIAASNKRV